MCEGAIGSADANVALGELAEAAFAGDDEAVGAEDDLAAAFSRGQWWRRPALLIEAYGCWWQRIHCGQEVGL